MININTSTQQLGVFGWNFSFIGNIKIVTDGDGNATILNSDIGSILPAQLPGTALYDTSNSGLPLDQLISSPYRLNSQQLLRQSSNSERMFKKQADGSYQGENGALTWNVDHYQLQETDGSLIVFRPDGQLNYIEDSNGYRLAASYTSNLLTKLSATNGDSFNLSYNTQGRIATVTDQRGQINTYTYDSTGQYLLSIKDPNGTTSFSYDNPYDPTIVTSVTYGDGRQVNYDYDAFGRLQQVIYGKGREALAYTYTYDNNGGVTVSDSSGATIKQLLNDQGEISQTIDPLGRTTNYIYDAAGNLVSLNSELGFSASFTYDSNGKVLTQTDALGHTTQFTYQANSDNLTGFRDARGNDVLYGYNAAGNLTSITYEDGTQDKYFYNTDGLLTKSINRRGQEIIYDYNNKYQITKETHSDGSIVTYEYGELSGLLTFSIINSGVETTRIDYDQAKNTVSMENYIGLVHTYKFDTLGRKTQIVIQDATNTYTTNYSYDNLGRLDKLTDGNGNLIVDYDYHPFSGLLAKETNGNGTYTNYNYDLAGQLISLVNSKADGSVNSRFDYTYDNLGRRTAVTTLDGTWNYSYDLTGQLTGAVFTSTNSSIPSQNLTYVYDAAGNRTQTIVNGVTENYTTNNLNQYQTAGTTTYSYDGLDFMRARFYDSKARRFVLP
jgi:YD repeat-containing protein